MSHLTLQYSCPLTSYPLLLTPNPFIPLQLTLYSFTTHNLPQLTLFHILLAPFLHQLAPFFVLSPKKEQVDGGVPCSKLTFFYLSHSLHFIYYLLLFYLSLLLFSFYHPKKEQVNSGSTLRLRSHFFEKQASPSESAPLPFLCKQASNE